MSVFDLSMFECYKVSKNTEKLVRGDGSYTCFQFMDRKGAVIEMTLYHEDDDLPVVDEDAFDDSRRALEKKA
tara:strand:+ start:1342 stop:1557 length:216 start_codon:yes stop_codon:yes gene_type:complete